MTKLLFLGWLLAMVVLLSFEPVRMLMLAMLGLGVALVGGSIVLAGLGILFQGQTQGLIRWLARSDRGYSDGNADIRPLP